MRTKREIFTIDRSDKTEAIDLPRNEAEWQKLAAKMLRLQIVEAELDFLHLAAKLATIGVHTNNKTISTRLRRGTYSAAGLFRVLTVCGVDSLHIPIKPGQAPGEDE